MTPISADIFRAYDVRGRVGREFGFEQALTIGRAIARQYPQYRSVMVGRDGRLSSPSIAASLMQGLRASGVDTIDVGLVPTPVLYYAAQRYNRGTGLVVTGSHNPPEYNGIKMMMGGETLAGEAIQAIYRACLQGEFADGCGRHSTREVADDYIAEIVADIAVDKKLRIVIDCGNGAAAGVAEKLFSTLAEEVRGLYCEIDGNFPNHHPDPSVSENLSDLRRVVVDGGYDAGIAFDGDGDRLGMVDNRGRIIWPDRQMMLYVRSILPQSPQATIIYDVKCSWHLAAEIERLGGIARMCRTGHSFIKSALKETNALLAGEMSGHIFFGDRWFGFDDGLYAAARMLEILSKSEGTCADLFDGLPDSVSTPELNVCFEREGMQHQFMEKLKKEAIFGDAKIITVDGLRVEFEDSWGLVRASNTTPRLVLRFEARNESALAGVQEMFRTQLLKVMPSLSLPF